ncbi:hypothetical protein [Myroides odoratus]|uniref:hypothetical protein n=1 Tax=Myroides odoratus TaxID=256 RepID=UPI00333E29BA
MTLLASWLGVDSRKPSSIYIMSDSRISWSTKAKFDYGKKVFGCKNSPDIFGYCGDVLFPSIVLNQIVEIADQGLLFKDDWNCEQKSQAIIEKLIQSFKNYPSEVAGITSDSIQIIHCSRDKDNNFYAEKINWNKSSNKWTVETEEFKDHSDKLFIAGSGKKEFLEKYKKYWVSSNKKTSRALFHCFTDTLSDIKDKFCGGAPQLVGLYRKDNAISFGIIYNKKRYFQGVQVDNLSNFEKIEWRNELFEVCDGQTMKIKDKAQKQPNVLKP